MDKKQKAILKKEQDTALNRGLVWVGIAILIELALMQINTLYFYITSETVARAALTESVLEILRISAPAGALVIFVMLFLRKKKGANALLWVVTGAIALGALGFFCHIILLFQDSGIRMLFILVPACGGLGLVYYLYQRGFFLCSLLSGFGAVGLWMLRHNGGRATATVYLFLVVTAAVFAAVCMLVLPAQKRGGTLTLAGIKLQMLEQGEGSTLVIITAVLNALCLALVLILGAHLVYYLIYLLAAWLFALLVYHTVKMM